jgi:DNA-directed RNA polymerase subunit RPC12/RpoP
MPQEQHPITVRYNDGSSRPAVRTGNNAAWHCSCGRAVPLVGYSDELESQHAYSVIRCPDCSSEYRVVAPGFKKVPTYVQQISRPVA